MRCELNGQIQSQRWRNVASCYMRTMLLRGVSFGRRFFPFDSSRRRRRRSWLWVLSWPVPRVLSDVYMCTSDSGSRDPPLYIHFSSLNHLCFNRTAFPSIRPILPSLPFRYLLFSFQHEDIPMPHSVQGERDAVKVQPSFLKRARSIVRSFSKGSRGIACRKPFISVSAEACPSRLYRERERKKEKRKENSSASFDKVSLT